MTSAESLERLESWRSWRTPPASGRRTVRRTESASSSKSSRASHGCLLSENPRDPAIVTGQFNVGEDNPAQHYLVGGPGAKPGSAALADTFRLLHPAVPELGSFTAIKFGETRRDLAEGVAPRRIGARSQCLAHGDAGAGAAEMR